jgi:hypothetical protein
MARGVWQDGFVELSALKTPRKEVLLNRSEQSPKSILMDD